ncbi:tetratricopeptide repeat protein [Deinococcus sp. AJ005]|uniref:tetratricopeptide repeat protein n=1 Tax=Deinococcus sp. AJ005 TaxID=2652443 RepID=UPI00125CBB42|nr:tetratricopeptide repeat protein [Deinococcus sp. AJ005]QFP77715.1 tetratricopeptide repeat protein [Deinococcus sp. AJ005]
MKLLTFGPLELQGTAFRREKPLLLLAYLSLRGTQERRTLARQFWPDAADPMNSLSVALGQLRHVSADLLRVTDTQVATPLECDVSDLLRACRSQDLDQARRIYRGAFAAGIGAGDLSDDLAEWLLATRESGADAYRRLLLGQARAAVDAGTGGAGVWAALAYAVPGAAPPDPETFGELHNLLAAERHPDAALLERQAAELGVALHAPSVSLTGRQAELARIMEVPPGQTLWLLGPAGIGKSALLAASVGTLLRGQGGRPHATLLALPEVPHPGPVTESAWAQVLSARSEPLLIDDWEACDPDSRRVLLALAATHAGPPLVIGSRERPPLPLPELTLRPLSALRAGELPLTGGIPALIHAHRQNLSLADAYAHLLALHPPRARQLLACLGIQETPDLKATQAALELGGEDMAAALERLNRACLLDGTRPTAPAALRAWLDTQPSLETEVLTLLAPHLLPADALPHYLRAHMLTGSSDLPGFQAVLADRTRALLAEDRQVEAHALLRPHAQSPETRLLLGRALDALGQHKEALKVLSELPDTPLVQVFRGRAVWRLGDRAGATTLANAGLNGDMEARAQAYNLLAALALAAQDYAQAHDCAQRSAALFMLLDDDLMRLKLVCCQAIAMQKLGRDVGPLLREMQESSLNQLPATVLLDIGWILEAQDQWTDALAYAQQAATNAESRQDLSTAAAAWNNVGVLHHKLGRADQAANAYSQAIHAARQGGEVRLLALSLGNLAELQESLPLIEEALSLLEGAGHDDLAVYFREQREAFRGRSGGG